MGIPLPRKLTNVMRKSYNTLVPGFIRRSRPVHRLIVNVFMGSWVDIDWKKRYRKLDDKEWAKYYDLINERAFRDEDTTANQKQEVIKNLVGKSVLEVGAGSGHLSVMMAKLSHDVTSLDCSEVSLRQAAALAKKNGVKLKIFQGFLEKLPFKDKAFDTVVCCHTLEHVKDLEKSVGELKRVCRKRLVVVVPEQEYAEYTTDLHTYFFPRPKRLADAIRLKQHRCYKVDSDIFYAGDI